MSRHPNHRDAPTWLALLVALAASATLLALGEPADPLHGPALCVPGLEARR